MIHDLDTATLDRLGATLPADAPIHMLNLLRFDPAGGRERYLVDYVGAFRALAAELGITGVGPVWAGDVVGLVAGPEAEAWDLALIVRYPTLAVFRTIVDSAAYRERVAPHRLAALVAWRLIAQREMAQP